MRVPVQVSALARGKRLGLSESILSLQEDGQLPAESGGNGLCLPGKHARGRGKDVLHKRGAGLRSQGEERFSEGGVG